MVGALTFFCHPRRGSSQFLEAVKIPFGNDKKEEYIALKCPIMPFNRIFSTYILTNLDRTVLYTGMTNDLAARLIEHWIGKAGSFTTRYHVYFLLWHEQTKYVLNAIAAEKTIKHYTRRQKEALINAFNPNWKFLNEEILGCWPPNPEQIASITARQAKAPRN